MRASHASAPASLLLDCLRNDASVRRILQGFQQATGVKLSLALISPPSVQVLRDHTRDHPFCEKFLAGSKGAVAHCIRVHTRLRTDAIESGRNVLARCAADLTHAAVAIVANREPVALLMAGGLAVDDGPRRPPRSKRIENLSRLLSETTGENRRAIMDSLSKFKSSQGTQRERVEGIAELIQVVARELESQIKGYDLDALKPIPATLARAIQFAKQHHTDPKLRPTRVAAAAGITRQRLAQLFRASLDVTFTDWFASIRISSTLPRLRGSVDSISTIALASGCGSISSFNRSFQKHIGISPSQYRRGIEPKRIPGRFAGV